MKQLASNYSVSGSTVTLTGVNVPLSQILLISNATTGTVLYSLAGPTATSYTQATNSTITLSSAPGVSDKLSIYYDDGVASPSSPALDGTDGTGITAPTGGSGIRGWLSGIYAALTGTPSVGAVSATNTVSTTGIVPSAGNLLINSTDVSAYRSVTLQTTPSGGVAGAFQAQVSSDGTNWVYISGQSSAPSSSGSTTSAYVSGAANNYLLASTTFSTFSLTGALYFRVYVTGGNGTGTVATTAFFSSLPVQPTLVQDSSNNLLVAGTMNNGPTSSNYAYSSSSTANGTVIIGALLCGTYRSLLLHVPQISGSAAIQVSNDNSNWSTVWPILVNSSTPMANVTGINQTGLFYAQLYGALYVRIILTSAITSSSTWNAVLSQQSYPLLGVNASLSANLPSPAPSTAQGFATYFTLVSAAGTNATSVKASAGTIGTCVLTNTTLSIKYVKLFNKASAPTMGTDTPVIQFPISANSTLDVSSAFAGLRLSTGIALATTGGSALLDNTSVAAGDVLVNMTYV